MDESVRQGYLKALGIESWMPEIPLPFAKVSPVLEIEELFVESFDQPVEQGTSVALMASHEERVIANLPGAGGPGGPESTRALMAATLGLGGDKEKVRKNKEKSKPTATTSPIAVPGSEAVKPNSAESGAPKLEAAEQSAGVLGSEVAVSISEAANTTPYFAFALLPIKGQDALLISLAEFDAPGFSRVEHQFLSDLFRALDVPPSLLSSPKTIFHWPMVQNKAIAQHPQAAEEALQAFLTAQREMHRYQRFVVMGESVARFMLPDVRTLDMGGWYEHAEIGAAFIITHSIQKLLATPLLKSESWKHLNQVFAASEMK